MPAAALVEAAGAIVALHDRQPGAVETCGDDVLAVMEQAAGNGGASKAAVDVELLDLVLVGHDEAGEPAVGHGERRRVETDGNPSAEAAKAPVLQQRGRHPSVVRIDPPRVPERGDGVHIASALQLGARSAWRSPSSSMSSLV